MYFKNIKDNDKVFGLVYGPGVVEVLVNSFYSFQVHYENGQSVPYTSDGVPGWGTLDIQTVFYPADVDILSIDLERPKEELTPKQIIKLRRKGKLMIMCPSNIWRNIKECPNNIMEDYLENSRFDLFKKAE